MKAIDLYSQLEKDFVRTCHEEYWFDYMADIEAYICDNFRQRSMGLVCDFAEEINKVYTAVFPSDKVLSKVLDDNVTDAMIFLHHPADWDLTKGPGKVFHQMNTELIEKLKERRVSIFNFHYPLDNFSQYSTSKTLAEVIGLTDLQPFAKLGGAMCGVIGTTDCKDIHELNEKYAKAVGHKTKLYQYGDEKITNNRVAVCAGGGNDAIVLKEVIENGVNILISGLSVKNSYSEETHKLEEEHKINLIGGTHYSSEKFACIAMVEYFEELGLEAEFIHCEPCFEDL